MYHATDQTVEKEETGAEAQRALLGELSNLKCGGALLKDYCTRLFMTPMTVKLRQFKRPIRPLTADVAFVLLAHLMYEKNAIAYFSSWK